MSTNRRKRSLYWQISKLRRRVIHLIYSKLYHDSVQSINKNILVAGTARSGTTWLADIIASQVACRLMFEPFHSEKVKAFRAFHYFQYMRPDETNTPLWSYCHTILTGKIRHSWIDKYTASLYPEYRLIKDIRANLFLKWLHNAFPEIPLVFIIRHPCSVVLSRMRLGWATDRDISSFLAQSKLMEDFLGEQIDIIKGAISAEEKHAVIWSVSNLIPLRQFRPGELYVIFYENLCTQPEVEISRLFQAVQLDYQDSVINALVTPSTTAKPTSAIVAGEDRLSNWRSGLRPAQINRILSIVEAFGLDDLYGESLTPNIRNPLSKLRHI